MRILVTGAAGFVGQVACRALSEAGHSVVAVTRSPPPAELRVDTVQVLGDLTGSTDWRTALSGIEVVVHLAGRAHVLNDDAKEAQRLYRQANVEVTEGLAHASVVAGVKRFVFASSIKVNGEETRGAPFRADDSPAPEDAYGESKLEAEQRLRQIAGGQMSGAPAAITPIASTRIEWVILRPPLMYGPGVRGNIARLLSVADRGWPAPFASIRNARDMLYVGSFADLIVRAASEPAAANRVFLARDGAPVSTPGLFRSMAHALGKRPKVVPCPVALLHLAGTLSGRAAEVRRLTGNLEIDDGETRRLLRWEPRIGFEDAIKLTAAAHKAQ